MSTDETSQAEPTPETVETAEEADSGPKFSWEQKEGFKIAETMKDVILKTIDASQSEIDSLRKKLEKLTYGS